MQTLPESRRFQRALRFCRPGFYGAAQALAARIALRAHGQRRPAACYQRNRAGAGGRSRRASRPTSHCYLCMRAMDKCGAHTVPILRLVAVVSAGRTIARVLDAAQALDSGRQFCETLGRWPNKWYVTCAPKTLRAGWGADWYMQCLKDPFGTLARKAWSSPSYSGIGAPTTAALRSFEAGGPPWAAFVTAWP